MIEKEAVAIVTGAGSGIGRAAAIAFARAGARVAVIDIDHDAALETAARIRDTEAIALRVDVTVEEQVVEAFDTVLGRWGRIDHLFNNAGIRGGTDEAHRMSSVEFRRVMDLNVAGAFLCQREALKAMYEAQRGTIVNMASIMGFSTGPGAAHYTASKHAVIGLTKAAAFEAAPRGVRVNAVAPGTIETPMNVALAGNEKAMRDRYTPAYPIGRLGRPREVAEAVLWLAGSASSFVTGHTLVLDGGYLLR
ncbi:SDR family NAD(P)-dependent oxidoreductase [Mesorhizobium sp. KR9-304]|uniref:SDR family NAD(P)-dependent oxidoreductase n=1 Tax=Mesorhizobium sp. KR9-304 TaxID=3156614 RepID=UPI0032B4D4AC